MTLARQFDNEEEIIRRDLVLAVSVSDPSELAGRFEHPARGPIVAGLPIGDVAKKLMPQ